MLPDCFDSKSKHSHCNDPTYIIDLLRTWTCYRLVLAVLNGSCTKQMMLKLTVTFGSNAEWFTVMYVQCSCSDAFSATANAFKC